MFEAYVTNLGLYSERGAGAGEYLKFPTTVEEVQALFSRIGIDGKQYEEYFITDYDSDILGLTDHLGEYESLDELNYLAHLLEEMTPDELEKLEAVMDAGEYTSSVKDLINLIQNLDCFDFYSDVNSEEELGRMYIQDFEAIIMLTALSGEEDQIKGLDLQVDDYITKPFSMPVLLRKIAAVLRRSNRGTDEKYQIITYGNLRLNCDGYTATVDGTNFELTQKEFEILRELLTHQGRILTRQNLLDKLWRYDFYGDERVVDTHIKNLRKKLGIDFIQTIRGVGYKVDKEN